MVSIVTTGGTTLSTAQSTTVVDDPTSTGLTLSDYISSNAEMTAYTNQIDSISNKLTSNTTTLTYYSQMQSLLQSLATAAQTLAGADNQGTASDVFAERSATLSSSTSTSASSLLSVSVDPGTTVGTHTVVVQQVATAEQIAGSGESSSSSALGYSGSFTIGAGSSSATVAVSATMTLSDIATAINNTTSTSGVGASVVEVTASSYILEITSSTTDASISMSDVSGGILNSLGVADTSGNAVDVITAAQPALLTVDGISGISRSTNVIGDVLTGMTLDLAQADTSTTLTIGVTANSDAITTAINSFVTAYNSWESFVQTQQATNTDGTAASTAVLFGDGMLRDASTMIGNSLAGLVDNNSLGAVGISFNSDYGLTLNTTSLSSALSDQFSTVASLFEFQTTSSSTDLTLESDTSSSYSGTLSLALDTGDSGTVTSVSATDRTSGDAVSFSVAGDVIAGASSGLASGLSFMFSGTDASASITVAVSQGIADSVYQICENFGNATTGYLQNTITSLTNQDTDYTSQKTTLVDEADTYYNELLTSYGNVESQISTNNTNYKLLTELFTGSSSSS